MRISLMAVIVGLTFVAQPGHSWAADVTSGNYYLSACSETLKNTLSAIDGKAKAEKFLQLIGDAGEDNWKKVLEYIDAGEKEPIGPLLEGGGDSNED